MEKDEVDYSEQGVHEKTYAPKTRVEIYEVLLSYQEHNAGRLVLDPRFVLLLWSGSVRVSCQCQC